MNTTVVNIRRNEYDVYIGREGHGQDGMFGNPFSAIKDGGRERAIALYRQYFHKRLRVDSEFFSRVEELRGKRLGCFCKPKACHGDIIADYLDIESKVRPYVITLMKNGFYTFSSCDGGNGHDFKKRMIRIDVDGPISYSVSEHGEEKYLKRFSELCCFIESQKWTYCSVLLRRTYIVTSITMELEAMIHFELIWN